MSDISGGPSPVRGPAGPAGFATPALPDIPVPADGIELIGPSRGSGYREPPALVRRGDGQMLQLTGLLYAVLGAIDGRRTVEQVAAQASNGTGRLVTPENVRTLIASHLLPLGLLRLADGSQPAVKKADPLLGMRLRYTVTEPERTRRITAPFAVLFNPLIVLAVTAVFLAASWWVLMVKGLASATHDAFANPGLLLLVFAVTVLSAGFHEFGHAAAARRGGATPGAMGVGLYLVWPAFYTDVTDSYRLGRGGRLRTDLGGLYFNAIVAVGVMGLWWLTRYDALLLVVVTQLLQMVRQLLPLLRFDGYHILADAAGVPDLFQRIRPTLLGLLPWHWNDPESKVLKPWARALVSIWVLVTVPLLLFSLAMLVIALPRLLGTAWHSVLDQQAMLAAALSAGDVPGAAVRVLALLAVVLPVAGIIYLLVRLVRRSAAGLWKKTRGRPLRRATAVAAAAAVAAGLAWAWWPGGDNYRPVQRYERGTLPDAAAAFAPATAAGPAEGLAEGRTGELATLWPKGSELPTRDDPQLAMVLVPEPAGTAAGGGPATGPSAAAPAPAWVFPFDQPPAPDGDGNQALAVNTGDGSVVYTVAFALVWAGDGPVDATNEAYAFASCTGCTAVAVGFQVVLVLGQADVVVPGNLSAAVNYNCLDCLSYALASQLVTTVDGPLSEAGAAELAALWEQIAEFGRSLRDYPLSDIQARLEGFKAQILDIIERDTGGSTGFGTSPEPTTAPGPEETATRETGPAPEPPEEPATTQGVTEEPAPQPAAPAPGTAPGEPAPETAEPAPAPAVPPPTAPAGTPAATTQSS
ncbi:hypothetical protein [Arthrobacter mobilis]|uniref:hypothetical protein n=1 Tax=Arthrobacter mobilis TaxID=2724944 RepID=UPI00197B4716|nr:hypothetical protein [Arthrobacter mobilis]